MRGKNHYVHSSGTGGDRAFAVGAAVAACNPRIVSDRNCLRGDLYSVLGDKTEIKAAHRLLTSDWGWSIGPLQSGRGMVVYRL